MVMDIKKYNRAKKSQEKRRGEYNKAREVIDTEAKRIDRDFDDKLWALRQKQRDASSKFYKKKDKLEEKTKISEKEDSEKIDEFRKILKMMKIIKGEKSTEYRVERLDYPRDEKGEIIKVKEKGQTWESYPDKQLFAIEPLELLKDNEFVKVGAYISKNDKPTNKFTLAVIGRTLFGDYNKDYGVGARTFMENICFIVKEAPSMGELEDFWNRNKERKTKELITKLDADKDFYEKVEKSTDSDEWELAYLESIKDYYERCVSRGEENTEYKRIMRRINFLGKKK